MRSVFDKYLHHSDQYTDSLRRIQSIEGAIITPDAIRFQALRKQSPDQPATPTEIHYERPKLQLEIVRLLNNFMQQSGQGDRGVGFVVYRDGTIDAVMTSGNRHEVRTMTKRVIVPEYDVPRFLRMYQGSKSKPGTIYCLFVEIDQDTYRSVKLD